MVARTVLFDTGENGPALLRNIRTLGLALDAVRCVAISHDHWDHWGGLWDLLDERTGLTVHGCPGFGQAFKDNVTDHGGRLEMSDSMREIAEGIYLSPQMETEYSGEVLVEQALYCVTEGGVSVITGCAHPGVLSFALDAVGRFPEERPNLILGGFHLGSYAPFDVDGIMSELRRLGFTRIIPTHCSGEYAASLGTERSWAGKQFTL
jgi:7,8-dihydropterin-6-yl-methyl-4-(beta-D-ribofuranosyl)aminobenzene 5'-phosphate synthase